MLLAALVLAAVSGAAMARDRRVDKQDRTRQMRALVGGLDRLGDLISADKIDEVVRQSLQPQIDGLSAAVAAVTRKLPAPRQQKFQKQAEAIVSDFMQQKPPRVLAVKALAMRRELLAALKINLSPVITPDFAKGASLYQQYCASCHGADGVTPDIFRQKLRPPPTELRAEAVMARMPPFRIYNDLIVGIPDTAKTAFADLLADDELWNVAFYAAALRFLPPSARVAEQRSKCVLLAPKVVQGAKRSLSLRDISSLRDDALAKGSAAGQDIVTAARLCVPFAGDTPR